jgi:hypothetical protein
VISQRTSLRVLNFGLRFILLKVRVLAMCLNPW